MSNYLLAISGGVDSVVLLDMFSKTKHNIIVAHVDHGIRGDDSKADARFVKQLAQKYNKSFVATSLNLSQNASEEQAREGRYNFLFNQAKQFNARIITAHHQNDIIETIALNIYRGTGWRGLAVMDSDIVDRPLLTMTKTQIYDYALRNSLEWVQDFSNFDTKYLRNKIRKSVGLSGLSILRVNDIISLRARQIQLKRDITKELNRVVCGNRLSRYFLQNIPDNVAIELLGTQIAKIAPRPTRPRLKLALHAIKTVNAGKVHQVGDGVYIKFTARKYDIKVI